MADQRMQDPIASKYRVGDWVVMDGSQTFQHMNGDLFKVVAVHIERTYAYYDVASLADVQTNPDKPRAYTTSEGCLLDGKSKHEYLVAFSELIGTSGNVALAEYVLRLTTQMQVLTAQIARLRPQKEEE